MLNKNRADEKKILANVNSLVQLLIELSYTKGAKKNALYDDAVRLLQELRPSLLGLIDGREELLESLTKQLVSQKLPHPFILNSFGDLQKDLNRVLAMAYSPALTDADDAPDVTEETTVETTVTAETNPTDIDTNPVDATVITETDGMNPTNTDICDTNAIDYIEDSSIVQQEAVENGEESPPTETTATSRLVHIQKILENTYVGETVCKNYVFRSLEIDYFVPTRKIAVIAKTMPLHKHRLYDCLLKKEGIKLFEINPDDTNDINWLQRQLPQ